MKGPNERAETRKTIRPREITRTKLKLSHRTVPSTEKESHITRSTNKYPPTIHGVSTHIPNVLSLQPPSYWD